MHWIALLPPDGEGSPLGWRALQFTPRVALLDEAVLLEVSASQRLWGGRQRLLERLLRATAVAPDSGWAGGPTSRVALAGLRLKQQGPWVLPAPSDFPLATLSAARPHLGTLARMGCRRWGELRALPRAGVARRFGADLLEALDAAFGERPERHAWLALPERFDMQLELPALASSAPELMGVVQRLLAHLQAWLQARQLGVLAFELEWALDLRRHDGVALPPHEQLLVRTARPAQQMAHLRRLAGERLAQLTLAAPANRLRLRALDTAPWDGANASLLPEERASGVPLHEFVERLAARLGPASVRVPRLQADHRPECMQAWAAASAAAPAPAPMPLADGAAQGLYPPWLLREPLPLVVRNEQPQYQGPLQLLTRAQRLEAGWWGKTASAMAFRDYYIARSPQAGLLWVFRERPLAGPAAGGGGPAGARWFLQGLYA
jgi:protein ImuB